MGGIQHRVTAVCQHALDQGRLHGPDRIAVLVRASAQDDAPRVEPEAASYGFTGEILADHFGEEE